MSTEYNFISNYYKSFSGTDTLVFILLPGSNPVVLGSITTVSYSAYRTKQPVINLGRTNINGVTRGARIYAGTMIFTLINQHWLNDLIDENNDKENKFKWLSQYKDIKADELPLFDLMIVSANEYGSYVSMFIYGVDVTDEAQVVSVEDLFTENTLSFVARDIQTFKAGYVTEPTKVIYSSSGINTINSTKLAGIYIANEEEFAQRLAKMDNNEYELSLERIYINKKQNQNDNLYKKRELKNFIRELQYNPVNLMVGDDVGLIQQKLREQSFLDSVNYMYDKNTEEAVKEFQSLNGLDNINGIVDYKTYLAFVKENSNNSITGIVINESGGRVYAYPNVYASITDILSYNSVIDILDKTNETTFKDKTTGEILYESGNSFYKIKEGYINVNDIYSYEYSNKNIAFPVISRGETGVYVTILQDLLKQLGLTNYISGVYDESTIAFVTKIQAENDIACILGTVNEDTWRIVQTLTGNLATDITNNNVNIKSQNAQGKYNLTSFDVNTDLFSGFDIIVNSNKDSSVKCCAIAYYDNNTTKSITKEFKITAQTEEKIPFSNFQNLFVYDPKNKYPAKIEYVVYPYNNECYKWIINYRGE